MISNIYKIAYAPILALLKIHPKILNGFFKVLRPELVACSQTYPSVINNGHLHIEKSIDLIRELGLKTSNPIIDIGAAKGIIASKYSQTFEDADIYAFEPLLENYRELEKLRSKFPKILSFNIGLGAEKGKKTINLNERITTSSLFESDQEITQDIFSGNLKTRGSEEITLSTLDDTLADLDQINLIKIDVQGYEIEVLKGASKTLKKTKVLVLEVMNHNSYIGAPKYYDIDNFVRSQGFELYDIIPSIRENNKLLEWDVIYVSSN